jgi:hypothetical protein
VSGRSARRPSATHAVARVTWRATARALDVITAVRWSAFGEHAKDQCSVFVRRLAKSRSYICVVCWLDQDGQGISQRDARWGRLGPSTPRRSLSFVIGLARWPLVSAFSPDRSFFSCFSFCLLLFASLLTVLLLQRGQRGGGSSSGTGLRLLRTPLHRASARAPRF